MSVLYTAKQGNKDQPLAGVIVIVKNITFLDGKQRRALKTTGPTTSTTPD